MSHDWLNLWKASRVQKLLHEQHGPNGGGSSWPATGARYCGKIVTGLQGGKLSTAKKIQFLQAPVSSFVCELFSVTFSTVNVRVLAPLNRTSCPFFSFCSRFHGWLWNFYSVTCIHPLQYTLTHPFILFSLCIIPSGGRFHILHRPTLMRKSKVISYRNCTLGSTVTERGWLKVET